MKQAHSILKVLASVLLLATTSVSAETVDESRPANPDARIEMSAVAGDIEVFGHDGDELLLTGRLGDDVRELRIEGDPDHWRIELENVENSSGWNIGLHKETKLKLMVPQSSRLEIRVVSADLTLNTLNGESVEVNTVSGDLTMRKVQPSRLRAQTVSGDLSSDSGGRDGSSLKTVSGDMEIQAMRGRIELETVSGDIVIDGEAISDAKLSSVSGELEARLQPLDDARLEFESHSGDVILELPAAGSPRLDAETFSGSVHSEFRGTTERVEGPGERLRIEPSTPDYRVVAKTFSGKVSIIGF